MNIDDFSEVIEKMLRSNEVKMIVTFPAGTMEPDLRTNLVDSPAILFYLMLHAMKKVFKALINLGEVDETKKEDILDGLFEMLREEILKEEAEDERKDP